MAVRLVKCKYCNEQFDRNKEPFVEVSNRRYAHKACAEKYQQSTSQEELDYLALEKYIKKLFNKNVLTARIKKQIKDYRQEYGYTYTGMQKTLYWWFEIKKNSIDQANEGIGIVPYVYNDALDYYYSLYLAKVANESLTLKDVKAVFVIGRTEVNEVSISARSDGSVNVQLILEKMGGGGHFNSAGVNKKGKALQDTYQELIKVLNLYLNDATSKKGG